MDFPDHLSGRDGSFATSSETPQGYSPEESDAVTATQGPLRATSHILEAIPEDGTTLIPPKVMRQDNVQVWRVRGESMVRCHLREGDHVIVQRCDTVKEGDMVLALLRNEEAALGRLHQDAHRVRLEGVYPDGEAKLLDEEDVTVFGVLVGILRKYT